MPTTIASSRGLQLKAVFAGALGLGHPEEELTRADYCAILVLYALLSHAPLTIREVRELIQRVYDFVDNTLGEVFLLPHYDREGNFLTHFESLGLFTIVRFHKKRQYESNGGGPYNEISYEMFDREDQLAIKFVGKQFLDLVQKNMGRLIRSKAKRSKLAQL